MIIANVAALILLQAPAPTQQVQEYWVDAGESIVQFSIRFAFNRVQGRFTQLQGTILYDSAHVERSSVTVVIDAKSLDTGSPHRDEHLRTADFFDAAMYPTIMFQSDELTRTAAGWIAAGTLTMHGVTKRITIPFHFLQPPTRSPQSHWMIMNFAGAVRLARADFGILGGSAFNSWFDKARAATMGDSVDITLEIEAYNADAQSQRLPQIEGRIAQIRAGGVRAYIDTLRAARQRDSVAFALRMTGIEYVVRALIADGRAADAVALSRAMTELFPTVPRAWIVHGVALAVQGDAPGAAREYAKGKALFRPPVVDPNEKFPLVDENWYYLDQLVRTMVEWGRPAPAVGLARTTAELYPTARAHATLGLALAAAGDAPGAAAAYARALELDPAEPRALERRRRLSKLSNP